MRFWNGVHCFVKYVPMAPVNNMSSLAQMVWHWRVDKPSPYMNKLIYVYVFQQDSMWYCYWYDTVYDDLVRYIQVQFVVFIFRNFIAKRHISLTPHQIISPITQNKYYAYHVPWYECTCILCCQFTCHTHIVYVSYKTQYFKKCHCVGLIDMYVVVRFKIAYVCFTQTGPDPCQTVV